MFGPSQPWDRVRLSLCHPGGGEGQWPMDTAAEQRWGLNEEQPFQWRASFLSPLPTCFNAPISLTQGAFCGISFIPEDVVEGWKKASGSAVVLTDDICS